MLFDGDNLAEALSNDYTSVEAIKNKNHFAYLLKYLGIGGLEAQYMLVEEEYVSKDYLHDYSAYYAFCFNKYDKFCKRVHFFNTTLTEEVLNKTILGTLDSPLNLQDNYLGFIVVKPIPGTVIGFTLLKSYNDFKPDLDRTYWGLREYKVHICGSEWKIKSLAFQEQDSVLAACATTAIWSMLNKASTDSHTILKSPNQITQDAASISSDGSRLFPNHGLSVLQICQAIFNSGLVSEVKSDRVPMYNDKKELIGWFVSNSFTKKILNAYAPIGIPVILVIRVPDAAEHGLHAITVTGFRQQPLTNSVPVPETTFYSDSIEKLYAHDDQYGPFVRVKFDNHVDLITPWTEDHDDEAPTWVQQIIVPLYPKIRISYEDIEVIVWWMDQVFTAYFARRAHHNLNLTWDIKIDFSESFKSELKESQLGEVEKLRLLKKSMPKYLWIITCYVGKFKVFDFVCDATDVNNNMLGQEFIWYLSDTEKKAVNDFLVRTRDVFMDKLIKKTQHPHYDFVLKQTAS